MTAVTRGRHRSPVLPVRIVRALQARRAERRAAWRDFSRGNEHTGYGSDQR